MLDSKQEQFLKSNKRAVFYCLSYADIFLGPPPDIKVNFSLCMMRVKTLERGFQIKFMELYCPFIFDLLEK